MSSSWSFLVLLILALASATFNMVLPVYTWYHGENLNLYGSITNVAVSLVIVIVALRLYAKRD